MHVCDPLELVVGDSVRLRPQLVFFLKDTHCLKPTLLPLDLAQGEPILLQAQRPAAGARGVGWTWGPRALSLHQFKQQHGVNRSVRV